MKKLLIFLFSVTTFGWTIVPCSQVNSQEPSQKVQSNYYPHIRLAQNQFGMQGESSDFRLTSQDQAGPFNQPQPTVKTVATRLKGFGIPFQLNAGDSFIEVQLYLSRDVGQTWQFQGRQSTDRNEFPFEAAQDGEYWFAIKTLNRDRRLLPEGDPQPELKIIVDTVKPTLEFKIEADAAGRVVCRWLAKDKNLSPESLQIYYQPVANNVPTKDWTKVPVELKGTARNGIYSDQLAWWPETSEQTLNVAIQISDVSGNAVQLYRQVIVAPSAWRHRQASTARITDTPKSTNPIRNPWVQPDSIQAPVIPSPNKTADARTQDHDVPPNVICEGGICRVIPNAKQAKATSKTQVKKSSDRLAQANTNPDVIKPWGGEFGEFADPPLPTGMQNASNQFVPPAASGSIEWESETEKWAPRNQSFFGSTVGVDPSIAPRPGVSSMRRPITNVPSNPSKMTFQGPDVVGQSSTRGATNQYQGIDSSANPGTPALVTVAPGAKSVRPSGQMQSIGKSLPAGNAGPQQSWAYPTQGNQNPAKQIGYENSNQPSLPMRKGQASAVVEPSVTRATKAPTQIIGSMRFRLNYGIDSIDPSGVAKVDLWMTRDEGRTWNAWGSDPNNESPFPVEVTEEGKYGFRVVVHSKDGLTGQGPSSGDDADMWILVDTTAPLTRITSVPYGRGSEAGRLIINYSVSDAFLTVRPITLLFATNPRGPWVPIEEGGRNDGRFVWKPTPQVPDRIFLRIESLDKAGNIGAHTLSQAIDVSGLIPRGTIHGVVPVGK